MKDKYLIGGWYVPPCSREQFQLLRECGLNTIFLVNNELSDDSELRYDWRKKVLTLCDEIGIDAYVQPDKGVFPRESADALFSFCSHPSFRGYIAFDEPTYTDFAIVREISKIHGEKFYRQNCFVNLLPTYASAESFGGSYRGYVEEYVSILKDMHGEKWLSFDFYPLLDSPERGYMVADSWLENVEIIADTAKKYDLPFNAFVQAMPYSERLHNRIPTYADLSLQVYTYLAYGAQGITYFCYGTPPVDFEFMEYQSALVDRNGAITELYRLVKSLNAEIRLFLSDLSSMRYVFTRVIGEYEGFEKLSRKQVCVYRVEGVNADGACLCGVFENENATGLVIVNYGETTIEPTKTVKVCFDLPRRVCFVQCGIRSEMYAPEIQLRLNAGEGCFIQVI